jgi:uncharacterized protein (DUF302 family)
MPVVKRSRHSFSETVAQLQSALRASGNNVFITIDQSAEASGAGLTLRPTTLIVFGNPKAGTLLMQADPLAALDLPIKFLIWEDAGAVSVAYTPASELAARYKLDAHADVIATIDRGLAMLVTSVE